MDLPNKTGETCVIIGNGPSLKDVPCEWLDKYQTFGCNYINRLPYQPTYYVCIDRPLLENNATEIIPTIERSDLAFISNYPANTPDMTTIRAMPNVAMLNRYTLTLPGETCMSGYTCVYVALKAAYHMGFARALLVGVDHSTGHFTDDYPVASSPRMDKQRYHFRVAANAWSAAGREIVNLSAPSLLDEVFRRGQINDY